MSCCQHRIQTAQAAYYCFYQNCKSVQVTAAVSVQFLFKAMIWARRPGPGGQQWGRTRTQQWQRLSHREGLAEPDSDLRCEAPGLPAPRTPFWAMPVRSESRQPKIAWKCPATGRGPQGRPSPASQQVRRSARTRAQAAQRVRVSPPLARRAPSAPSPRAAPASFPTRPGGSPRPPALSTSRARTQPLPASAVHRCRHSSERPRAGAARPGRNRPLGSRRPDADPENPGQCRNLRADPGIALPVVAAAGEYLHPSLPPPASVHIRRCRRRRIFISLYILVGIIYSRRPAAAAG